MTGKESNIIAPGRMAVVGMFDGLHLGHRFLLDTLRERAATAGCVPLAITFSNHPLEIIAPDRAPRLLSPGAEKEALLDSAGVDWAQMPFTDELRMLPAGEFLKKIKNEFGVTAMLLGFNNRFGHDAPRDVEEYALLGRSCGVEIIQADEFVADNIAVSSSAVRAALSAGDTTLANRLLGRRYSIGGSVGHGHAIGRTIGFPTANISPDDSRKLIPAEGVYAAIAITTDGNRYKAVVNIGRRPTVEKTDVSPNIEAHLLDFEGDLYGSRLNLELTARLRGEKRYPSLDALKAGIAADIAAARLLLP